MDFKKGFVYEQYQISTLLLHVNRKTLTFNISFQTNSLKKSLSLNILPVVSFSLLIHVLNCFELVFSVDGAVVVLAGCYSSVVRYGHRSGHRCSAWPGMVVVVVDVVTRGLVWCGPVFVEGCRWWTWWTMVDDC